MSQGATAAGAALAFTAAGYFVWAAYQPAPATTMQQFECIGRADSLLSRMEANQNAGTDTYRRVVELRKQCTPYVWDRSTLLQALVAGGVGGALLLAAATAGRGKG